MTPAKFVSRYTQGNRERVRAPVQKKIFGPHSKGGPAKSLYDKSEKLSLKSQSSKFDSRGLIDTVDSAERVDWYSRQCRES